MDNHSADLILDEKKPSFNVDAKRTMDGRATQGFPPHYFILLALVLWTFGCNLIWTLLDTRPPSWDQGAHLHIAFKYWQAFTSGSDRMWLDLLSVESFYPPFYHLSLLPVFAGLGFSADNAVITNSFFLAVAIIATYGIGERLYDRRTALLAAFLIACYPFLAYISRQCLIDTMLTAAVSLSYYLFLRCNNFEDRRYSFLFSLTFAAGMMVKWTFFIYLFPAVLYGLFKHDDPAARNVPAQAAYYLGMIVATMVLPLILFILADGRWVVLLLESVLVYALVRYLPVTGLSPNRIINLLTLALINVLVCFPWYAHNLAKMTRGVSKFGFPDAVLKGFMEWPLPVWGYYLEAAGRQMGMPLFFLFAAAFIGFLFRRKDFNWLLCGWIVFSYTAFTFINNKGVRYTMPCLTAVALISALLITRISPAKARRWATGVVVGVGLFTYIYAGFLPGEAKFPGLGGPALGFKEIPVKEDWPIDAILDDIVQASSPSAGEAITVRTLTNHPWFHRGAFRDAAEIRGLPIVMKSVKRNTGELTDYFITKESSEQGESGTEQIDPKRNRLFNDPALQNTFSLFRAYPLPNGTNGLVLKRDVKPATGLEGADDLSRVGELLIPAFSRYPIYGIKDMVNAKVAIVPTDNKQDLLLGRYKKISVTADSALSNKIRFENFELTFTGVQINLFELFMHGKLIFLEIGRLFPRGTVQFEQIEQLAEKAMKGKGDVRLEGDGDRIHVTAHYQLPRMELAGKATARLIFEPQKKIRPVLESLVVGPVAAREIFYRRILDEEVDLNPTPGWPLYTDIRAIKIYPRKVEINPSLN